MAFALADLDDIKSRIKVSDVVGRHFKLVKQGNEFIVADNQSFTINDTKKFYKDFGNGGDKAGDIFDFLVNYQGYSLVDAVEELASQAGVTLSNGSGRASPSPSRPQNASLPANGHGAGAGSGAQADGRDRADSGVRDAQPRGKKEVVAQWDYVDPENSPLYQVVRMQERMPDGQWRLNREGKVWKTFMQRRPSPDGDGSWVLGLDLADRETGAPHEFMRLHSGSWVRFNEENFEKWRLKDRRSWPNAGNVQHWLYNANAVIDELQEPREDQRTIYLPEGEAKVDVLRDWDLLAVTNSGGAGHFTAECAEFFRNAADVVILADNDRAGAERVAKIAPMLVAVGASVRALNFKDVWPACPQKGDVKDWRDKGGGTREQLLEIVDSLKPWTPEPYKSKFGAKTSIDLRSPAKPYPWRIKGVVPLNDTLLIIGPSGSGKTFETLDMAMHVCTGKPTFAGRKVVPGGVVYLAYEGTSGFENRVRAYMIHHNLTDADLHSFAWLTRPPNLFTDEANVHDLAKEIVELSSNFRYPLGAIVIDTHNASTRGSSEVKSDEVGKIMNHHDIISTATGVRPWIIGHTNSEGKHRGNEQFHNTIETVMLIEKVHENNDPKKPLKRDDDGEILRRVRMKKQRDASDEVHWDFVLRNVVLGKDEEGDDIPSAVSVEPARRVPDEVAAGANKSERPSGFPLKGHHLEVFVALLAAMKTRGVPPPSLLGLPASVAEVVQWKDLGIEYKKRIPQEQDESPKDYQNKIKARTRRFREDLTPYNIIGIATMPDPQNPEKDLSFTWPTGKRVYGKGLQWPPLPPKKKIDDRPIVDQATGREITDMEDTGTVF